MTRKEFFYLSKMEKISCMTKALVWFLNYSDFSISQVDKKNYSEEISIIKIVLAERLNK